MQIVWSVKKLYVCDSTFTEARTMPAWSIAATEQQNMGRGRFNRRWFGDKGGMWATYNLPIDVYKDCPWGLMPLVAGAALMETLNTYGIEGLRLRWPNDVLVKRSKLAGILVERPCPSIVSVGIGINVHNDLSAIQGKTTDPPVRLADLVNGGCPNADEIRDLLAAKLAAIYVDFTQNGSAQVMKILARSWGEARPVVAITDTERICGFFDGIEEDGSPILKKADGTRNIVPAISINRMKELI